MAVPTSTTVLVIGGGPAGSYAAACLAREGVDVVVLEADKFPRYHIGESMIASMRYFLRFVDLEDTFDNHGFEKKYGATFKLNEKRAAFTDFGIALGPGGHTWNVVRSESDDLIFRHAGKCGAKIFDQTKVNDIEFEPYNEEGFVTEARLANPGKPVSATWSRKDGSNGKITFDYLVDASGRAGVISTKYLKNRRLNEALKNIANWTYWKGAKRFAEGEHNENSPLFEALKDGSGWCWAIPLQEGRLSVGIVARQDIFTARKKASGLSSQEFYRQHIWKYAPQIAGLLEKAEIVDEIKQASDWSYSANAYAGPHMRLAGDAGCFIDPYFSSGVHLALVGGLSAAVTIQAARRGDCDELTAAKWHSGKVTEGYTRFLLVVMTVLRQVRMTNRSLLAEEHESGFDRAFKQIQPVIQGVADSATDDDAIQKKASDSVYYALGRLDVSAERQKEVLDKIQEAGHNFDELEKLTPEEVLILKKIAGKQRAMTVHSQTLEAFTGEVIDGLAANIERGKLGLISSKAKPETNGSLTDDKMKEHQQMMELNRKLAVKA